MMYCGMISTWNGSSSVPIIAANRMPRPLNWTRANAYAARAEESTVPITETTAIRNEFAKNRHIGTPAMPSLTPWRSSPGSGCSGCRPMFEPNSPFGLNVDRNSHSSG